MATPVLLVAGTPAGKKEYLNDASSATAPVRSFSEGMVCSPFRPTNTFPKLRKL